MLPEHDAAERRTRVMFDQEDRRTDRQVNLVRYSLKKTDGGKGGTSLTLE